MNTKQAQEELRSAAFRGDVDALKNLLLNGADINSKDDDGNTALIEAVRAPSPEATKFLLGFGADVEAGDLERATPLMWAIRSTLDESYEQTEVIVKLLIDHGADLNAQTDSGATALIYAVRDDEPDLVRTLLEAGADPNVVTNAGWTALDYVNESTLTDGATRELLLMAGAMSKRQIQKR